MKAEVANRRQFAGWLGAAMAVAAAAGCDLMAPGVRKQAAGSRIGGGGRLVEPKRCALTVVILTRPQNDPVLNGSVWEVADEQVATPELRRALQTNGLRVGRISGDLPAEVQALLKAGPPEQPDVQMIVNPSGQSTLIDAAHAPARSRLNLLVSQPDGKVLGKVYEDAKGWIRLTATHEGTEQVALRVVPELHHGPVRSGFGVVPTAGVAVPREFQLTQGQAEETFRELGVTVVVGPGQVAVLGARPERSGTLGDLIFQKLEANSDRVLQSVVLIWADRNERGSGPGAGVSLEVPEALLPAGAAEGDHLAEPK
ncbi:MAG: hypothetical protein KatS3mg108_3839 [Isosphaeraceae bacterium]|jgi:hypothetical protein|nr:MAG: hypothetical protein KatS3mg108_3839 [Isosphaeraceae bacterium]